MVELGDKVKDNVSGFTGVVTAITHFLNGCTQCEITPKAKEGEKYPEIVSIDIGQLIIIAPKRKKVKKKPIGGATQIVNRIRRM